MSASISSSGRLLLRALQRAQERGIEHIQRALVDRPREPVFYQFGRLLENLFQ